MIRIHNSFVSIAWKSLLIAAIGGLTAWSPAWSGLPEVHLALTRFFTWTTAACVDAMGLPVHVDGRTVYSIGYSVRIVPECDALLPTVTLVAACLLLNAAWRTRGWLALAAIAGVGVANQLRIVMTLVIGTRSVRTAELAHDVVFPLLIVGVFASLWYQWLLREQRDASFGPMAVSVGRTP